MSATLMMERVNGNRYTHHFGVDGAFLGKMGPKMSGKRVNKNFDFW